VKLGETIFDVTVWAVLPGRTPGQRDGLLNLTWKGRGHAIHLHTGGTSDGRMEHYGAERGPVSGTCPTTTDAQKAADAYLAAPALELAIPNSRGSAADGAPDSSHLWTAAEATGAAMVLAAEHIADETARVLAQYGTSEKQLEYALLEARRVMREAYAAAGRKLVEAGATPAARLRHDVACRSAYARRAAETATAVAWYAREISAAPPPAGSGAGDDISPYDLGWSGGNRMLTRYITHRPADFGDREWLEWVTGYAEGARLNAQATVLHAEAVREQAQKTLMGPLHAPASPDRPSVRAQGVVGEASGRGEAGRLAGEPVVTSTPRPGRKPGRRATSTGIVATGRRQTRPGGPQ
jgi:hypothetical protein